jgi:hypothetical protein
VARRAWHCRVACEGIAELIAYRRFMGAEQWQVRWEGAGEEGDTWERWAVLDTEELRRRADALRADA